MAHAFPGRRRYTRDVSNDRLGHVFRDELCCVLFGRAANFTHHDDAFGFLIVLEQAQHVDEIHPLDGVAADADAG